MSTAGVPHQASATLSAICSGCPAGYHKSFANSFGTADAQSSVAAAADLLDLSNFDMSKTQQEPLLCIVANTD